MKKKFITRFAPSPTGHLHMGHAYSAIWAFNLALKNKGTLKLRIEDIDHTRCKPELVQGIIEDLTWLGIKWEGDIWYQSKQMDKYCRALETLDELGLTYPCFCTRADIKKQIENSSQAPHGPEGFLYPGTCKTALSKKGVIIDKPFAIRLDVDKAVAFLKTQKKWPLYFEDSFKGKILAKPEKLGDVVLARKDINTSYHLSVTVDDHLQNISHIVRGNDLFFATHIHRLLQELFGFNIPHYSHHDLLADEHGERLAKREGAPTIKSFRDKAKTKKSFIKLMNEVQKI